MIALLVALILYPVCFAAELNLGKYRISYSPALSYDTTISLSLSFSLSKGNRPVWEFGWAYGVGWGAAIFLFGAVVLLLCDKESEEIYYKERKIVHDASMRD